MPILKPTPHGHGTSMGQVGTDAVLGRLLRQKATRGAWPNGLWDELPECSGSVHLLRD
jgi:hypothetical protein